MTRCYPAHDELWARMYKHAQDLPPLAERMAHAPLFDTLSLLRAGAEISRAEIDSAVARCDGRPFSLWVPVSDTPHQRYEKKRETIALRIAVAIAAYTGETPGGIDARDAALIDFLTKLDVPLSHVRAVSALAPGMPKHTFGIAEFHLHVDFGFVSGARCLFVFQVGHCVLAHAWATLTECEREHAAYFDAHIDCALPHALCSIEALRVHAIIIAPHQVETLRARAIWEAFARVCIGVGNREAESTVSWLVDRRHGVLVVDGMTLPPPWDERSRQYYRAAALRRKLILEMDEPLTYIDICGDARLVLGERRAKGDGRWHVPRAFWQYDDDDDDYGDDKNMELAARKRQDMVLNVGTMSYDLTDDGIARAERHNRLDWLIKEAKSVDIVLSPKLPSVQVRIGPGTRLMLA